MEYTFALLFHCVLYCSQFSESLDLAIKIISFFSVWAQEYQALLLYKKNRATWKSPSSLLLHLI